MPARPSQAWLPSKLQSHWTPRWVVVLLCLTRRGGGGVKHKKRVTNGTVKVALVQISDFYILKKIKFM